MFLDSSRVEYFPRQDHREQLSPMYAYVRRSRRCTLKFANIDEHVLLILQVYTNLQAQNAFIGARTATWPVRAQTSGTKILTTY